MEPLFINHYTITKDVFREFQWKAGKYPLFFVIVGISFALCMFALGASGIRENIAYLILLAVLAALIVGSLFLNVKRNWARVMEQSNGAPVEVTMTFTEENALNESKGSEGRIVLEYSSIKKVLVTKNLIILMTKAKLGHILRRDAFTLGSEEEFMQFINSKIALNGLK